MELSPRLTARLHAAADLQATYVPSDAIKSQVADKMLGMVIAPTAMGKTYVMNRAIELDAEFSRVSVFTTRAPRPDDGLLFRYYERTETDLSHLMDKIEHHELVQYAVFPHSGQIYGSEPSDFTSPYTLLATLANSVEQLTHVGLERVVPIGLITQPVAWRQWFEARYADRPGDHLARLQEAGESIDWLLAHDDVVWLVNDPSDVDRSARELIDIVRGSASSDQSAAYDYAHELRQLITMMIGQAA